MDIEILSVNHYPSADRARIGKLDTLVIYRIDNKRNDTLVIPDEIDDAKVLQARITEKAKTRGAAIGHKFSV